MKEFYSLIIPLALTAVGNISPAGEPVIPVSSQHLYNHVREITAIYPPRNFRHLDSLQRTGDYIFKAFNSNTDRVEVQFFRAEGREYKNIIASFGPEIAGENRIIVGAHYDVCSDQPGADDNASGAAALLELGRLLSTLKPPLKKRIDLVAYGLEEPPYFRTPYMGSAVHARSLAEKGIKIKVMISVDAIGYFSITASPSFYVFPFIKSGEFLPGNTTTVTSRKGEEEIVLLIKKYMSEKSKVAVLPLNLDPVVPGVDFSDHLNFWNQGYPGVMISNAFTSPNPNYHRPGDTIDTLDFDKIAEIVKGIYWALIQL